MKIRQFLGNKEDENKESGNEMPEDKGEGKINPASKEEEIDDKEESISVEDAFRELSVSFFYY